MRVDHKDGAVTVAKTVEELYKKDLMTQITTMVWSLTQSQTSWSVKF